MRCVAREISSKPPGQNAKRQFCLCVFGLIALFVAVTASGDQVQAPKQKSSALAPMVNIQASVSGSLVISQPSLTFAASNPSASPVIPANSPVSAFISITGARPSRTWTLDVKALGPNLVSGSDTIPVNNVSWTATGTMTAGNGSITVTTGPVPLSTNVVTTASGSEGNRDPFTATVTYNFSFADSWDFVPGTYAQTVQFTLTAP